MLLQIEFLEVRLAEVMAYADIPINMRPALTELSSGGMSAVAHAAAGAGAGPYALNLQHLSSGLSSHTDGSDTSRVAGASAGSGVAGGIKATQVELVRGALLGCLKMLRQMSEALGESLSALVFRCLSLPCCAWPVSSQLALLVVGHQARCATPSP
jgi:centrosomal protein CEP290